MELKVLHLIGMFTITSITVDKKLLFRKTLIKHLKLVSAIFIKFLFFHQMIALQKL